MIKNLNRIDLLEAEKKFLIKLCSNSEILSTLEKYLENEDSSLSFVEIISNLCNMINEKILDIIDEKVDYLNMYYGTNGYFLENLESDISIKEFNIESNILNLGFYIDNDSDHIILSLSGIYKEIDIIYDQYFNGNVKIFVNDIPIKNMYTANSGSEFLKMELSSTKNRIQNIIHLFENNCLTTNDAIEELKEVIESSNKKFL